MGHLNKSVLSKATSILKAGRTSKALKSYKVMPKDFSPELKELILTGCRMRKTFDIKPEHIEKALRDVRKAK